MSNRFPGRFAALCAIGLGTFAAVGCGELTASENGATALATSTQPSSMAGDEQCLGSKYTGEQFVGSWTEAGSPVVTTLARGGSLQADNNGVAEFGTWTYVPLKDTPSKGDMPVSDAARCALWMSWQGKAGLDLVFLPLKLTENSLELSYVGRGNTVVWLRAVP